MSPREKAQEDIVEYLENDPYFTAPYGITEGMQSIGKGKIRVVGFGVSRYLDANIEIWSHKDIRVKGQGGLAYKFEGNFASVDALISHFKKETKFNEN
jgi:hypothetical protein